MISKLISKFLSEWLHSLPKIAFIQRSYFDAALGPHYISISAEGHIIIMLEGKY